MGCKSWKRIGGKLYYRQATYKYKYGAVVDAQRRRKRGQKVRIIKSSKHYILYIKR